MLLELHREIDARTREIAASRPAWPCRKGCAECCRRLADLPRLTAAEWDMVAEGLANQSVETQAAIRGRIESLAADRAPFTCPFLDRESESCLIYESRPVACRTYGFYVERDRGLYCGEIEKRVDSGEFADVVWGNVAGVDARLASLGEKIGMLDSRTLLWLFDDAGKEERT